MNKIYKLNRIENNNWGPVNKEKNRINSVEDVMINAGLSKIISPTPLSIHVERINNNKSTNNELLIKIFTQFKSSYTEDKKAKLLKDLYGFFKSKGFKLSNYHNVSIIHHFELNYSLHPMYIANILSQLLTRREAYQRNIKFIAQNGLNKGLSGLRIEIKGRIRGVKNAKKQIITYGKVNRNTFNNKIEYAFKESINKYGACGIKVWVSIDYNKLKRNKSFNNKNFNNKNFNKKNK